MTSRRWILSGLALVGVGALAGIGLTAVASGDGPPDDQAVAAAGEVEARLERVDSMSYGTWPQHSAGAYLDYLANTVKVEPCMAAKGEQFGYRFIDPYAGRPEDTGIGGTWTEPLMSTSSSELALATARYNWLAGRFGDGNPDMNWDDKTASYQRAYGQCRHLRENDPGHPSGYLELPSELSALVGSIDEKFGTSSDYDDCMLEAGYDVYWDDFGGPGAMHQMVEAEAPSLDLSPKKLVKTDEWASFLSFEQEVLAADYDCRAAKYVDVMAELEAPLAKFESDNADELDALETEWNAIAAKAQRLGWTPSNA